MIGSLCSVRRAAVDPVTTKTEHEHEKLQRTLVVPLTCREVADVADEDVHPAATQPAIPASTIGLPTTRVGAPYQRHAPPASALASERTVSGVWGNVQSCRAYGTDTGLTAAPTVEQLVAALAG
jgi:hypothetical protein